MERLAIVSGGSSGIGYSCAERLLGLGHRVVLIGRSEERLRRACEALKASGSAIPQPLDVRDDAACRAAIADLVSRFGAPEWLVTSAGIARPGLFLEQPLDDHVAQLTTNYLGTLHLVHACAPEMAAAGGGRIVMISSAAALLGVYGYAAYAPSKYAVHGLAEVLRVELAAQNISVTVAFPSDTRTPQLAAEEQTRPEVTKAIAAGGGVWEPDAVAQRIIAAAQQRRFFVGPGLSTALLASFRGMLGSLLRLRAAAIVRRVQRKTERFSDSGHHGIVGLRKINGPDPG